MPGHSFFSGFTRVLVDAILFWLDHHFPLVDHHFLQPFQQKVTQKRSEITNLCMFVDSMHHLFI